MAISRRKFLYSGIGIVLFANDTLAQTQINFKNPPKQTTALAGETLFDVAERTVSPIIGLIKLNNLSPPYEIYEGQIIKLPPLKVHIAKAGDTIETIGARYSVDPRSLAVFNGLPKPYVVKPGQKIILPALVRDKLTGLEPQDLISLLANEINRGNEVSGKQPQIKITKPPVSTKPPISPPNIGDAKNYFIWPLNGKIVDTFGEKAGFKKNDGIDIEAPKNTPFVAAADGVVVYSGNQLAGYGWLILIKHSNNYITAYAYGSQILVAEKQIVKKGQIIGKVGLSGRAATPRLQFQIRKGVNAVNPIPYLPKRPA